VLASCPAGVPLKVFASSDKAASTPADSGADVPVSLPTGGFSIGRFSPGGFCPGPGEPDGGLLIEAQLDDPVPSTPAELPHAVTGTLTGTSDPLFAVPPVLLFGAVLMVQPALAPPSTLPPLPHTVTGAETGALTVESPSPLAGAVSAAGTVQPAWALPTALPQTVTGAFAGAEAEGPAVLPEPVLPEPVLPDPVLPDPVPPDVPVVPEPAVPQFALPSPAAPTELPQTVTGAFAGAEAEGPAVLPEAVLPEAVLPVPVLPDPVPPDPVLPDVPVLPDPAAPQLALPSPTTPTELPQTLTGAVTGADTAAGVELVELPLLAAPEPASPDPTAPEPVPAIPVASEPTRSEAVIGVLALVGSTVTEPVAVGAVCVSSTETAFPPTLIGTSADTAATCSMGVGGAAGVSAEAIPDPRTQMPPMKMPVYRHRFVHVFMTAFPNSTNGGQSPGRNCRIRSCGRCQSGEVEGELAHSCGGRGSGDVGLSVAPSCFEGSSSGRRTDKEGPSCWLAVELPVRGSSSPPRGRAGG
jgi:hypothetical protein